MGTDMLPKYVTVTQWLVSTQLQKKFKYDKGYTKRELSIHLVNSLSTGYRQMQDFVKEQQPDLQKWLHLLFQLLPFPGKQSILQKQQQRLFFMSPNQVRTLPPHPFSTLGNHHLHLQQHIPSPVNTPPPCGAATVLAVPS